MLLLLALARAILAGFQQSLPALNHEIILICAGTTYSRSQNNLSSFWASLIFLTTLLGFLGTVLGTMSRRSADFARPAVDVDAPARVAGAQR